MLRVLATGRWLGALAAATLFAILAFHLGQWQWGRYQERRERAERITAHYDALPVPVGDVLTGQPLPRAREWTRVQARGEYAAGPPLLVRNRPRDGTYGYEVLVPLTVPGVGTVLVDRGWVPNARSAQTLPQVPPAPTGPVTVTGWLRPGEPSLGRRLPPGQLASIHLAEAQRQTGQDLLGGYLVLQQERTASGSQPPRPVHLERPDTGVGPHQAYALQWWGAMAVGFVLVYVGVRRDFHDGPGAGAGSAAPARPRRVRIWDEEDA